MTVQEQQQALLDSMTPKNEKVSWKRKQKNIENLVEEIGPLEDQILELIAKKSSIMDLSLIHI